MKEYDIKPIKNKEIKFSDKMKEYEYNQILEFPENPLIHIVATDVTVRLPYGEVFGTRVAMNPGATVIVRGNLVGYVHSNSSLFHFSYSGREITEAEYRSLRKDGFELSPSRVEVESRENIENINPLRGWK